SQRTNEEDEAVLKQAASKTHVIALNKSDLPTFSNELVDHRLRTTNGQPTNTVSVSAATEEGLSELRAAILKPFGNGNGAGEGLLITNARHHDLLVRAMSSIASSAELIRDDASEEIVLIGLHNALRFIGELTGETTTEDMLGEIFSTFCIGK
ncbi:MAG TPA: hypothetical protein VEX68_05250, partial [Bryobacteraceae bacterium]|nr:hypothetical protein [Bryobacteraceae bacterium]